MVQPLAERNKEENVILAVFICIVSPKHITHNYICIYIYIHCQNGFDADFIGIFIVFTACNLFISNAWCARHMSRNNDPILHKRETTKTAQRDTRKMTQWTETNIQETIWTILNNEHVWHHKHGRTKMRKKTWTCLRTLNWKWNRERQNPKYKLKRPARKMKTNIHPKKNMNNNMKNNKVQLKTQMKNKWQNEPQYIAKSNWTQQSDNMNNMQISPGKIVFQISDNSMFFSIREFQ